MTTLDWSIVAAYCCLVLLVGAVMSRRATRSVESYFLGERKLSWWLIGIADVSSFGSGSIGYTMILYLGGFMDFWLYGWAAWCIWMPLVAVIWAKMWRRLGVVTTGEFIEVRYGGKLAAVYRGLYASYAFFVWSVASMAYVGTFFVRSVSILLGWPPVQVLVVFGAIIVLYTMLSGIIGVVYTDVLQFALVFSAGLLLAYILIHQAGGMAAVVHGIESKRSHEFLQPYPPGGRMDWLTLVLLVFQGFFYAGHPFAGEGSTAQKFLAAKNERHAVGGQLLNLMLSLVIRLIPGILIGMAAIVLYPRDRVSVPPELWAMAVRDYAGPGVVGFLFASAVAAYMATTATTLNWGSSYFINDVYRRHLRPHAGRREFMLVSRLLALLTLTIAYTLALSIDARHMEPWILFINSTVIAFSLPLAWLKWFWWRMNVFGDAVGMLGGVPVAAFVWFGSDAILPETFRGWMQHTLGLNITGLIPRFGDLTRYPFWMGFMVLFGLGWVVILTVTLLTRPESEETLRAFYERVRPIGWWGPVAKLFPEAERKAVRLEAWRNLAACTAGIVFTYTLCIAFFSIFAYRFVLAGVLAVPATLSGILFFRLALRATNFRLTPGG